MHYGKKASQWRKCDTLAMFYLETFSSSIHVDVTFTSTTYLTLFQTKDNGIPEWQWPLSTG